MQESQWRIPEAARIHGASVGVLTLRPRPSALGARRSPPRSRFRSGPKSPRTSPEGGEFSMTTTGEIWVTLDSQGTRQRPVATARALHHLVMAKGVVVVETFVAQREPVHALAHHRHDLATFARWRPSRRRATPARQYEPAVHLAQQQCAPMGGNRTAGEIRTHPPTPTP